MWPPQRRIGQLLGGKYRVQQLLALGGMGVIYAACHELTGRAVAIKLLRPELATRPELLRRVAVEARLAVEASHPNVVEVLDAGADELGIPFVVLERLYGQPLEAMLGERLSLIAAAQALLPVMNALVALHEAGIVHRDIKPSNIFLSAEADRIVPKLLDFGIAKALTATDSTLSSVGLGTPSYMAPEQALGCVALGPSTDVWSMAVVFVRCLTGRLPFAKLPARGPSVSSFAFDAARTEHVPLPVALVLARALQLDPHDRFADMAELRSALLEALRQVDERERWPSEITIAHAASEFVLASALPLSEPHFRGSSGSGRNGRRARPVDMLTRTLSRAWHTRHGRHWRGAALAVSFAIVAATALEAVSSATHKRGEFEDQATAALAAKPIDSAAVITRGGDLAPVPLHASTGATGATDAEPLVGSRPSAQAKVEVAAEQKRLRVRATAPAEKLPVVGRPEVSMPLGPNRAPIIE